MGDFLIVSQLLRGVDWMKRSFAVILIFILAAGALTGCGPDQEKLQHDFIAITEKPASEETVKEATKYLDQYLPGLDEETASEMVLHLEHYTLSFNQQGITYSEWAKHYDKYIASYLKDLYKIKEKEQENPIAADAVLKVDWAGLAQRTYEMEQYIREYKDKPLIAEDAAWLYGNYMNAMVMGTNGTPVFDYKTHAFSEAAKTVYAAFINKYPDSTTAWALTEYFTYLDSIRYTMDYNDKISSKLFFDTCDWLVSEAGKRVFQ